MSHMLTGEIAKYQIEDRVRAAETDRVARSVRVKRDRNPSVVRRVGSGLLAGLASIAPSTGRPPARHAKPA